MLDSKSEIKSKAAQDGGVPADARDAEKEIPPTYQDAIATGENDPYAPQPHEVVAHLKLLCAIFKLRENVMNDNTMFGLDDSWLPSLGPDSTPDAVKAHQLIAEKRWDLYVHRAVLRFESWWYALKAQMGTTPVMVRDLVSANPISMNKSTKGSAFVIGADQLPPLDVLMVWHAFLLSPRQYLEDCLRGGMVALWYTKFPWAEIDQAIDDHPESAQYRPNEQAVLSFEQIRPWANIEDACTRSLSCPGCGSDISNLRDSFFSDRLQTLRDGYHQQQLSNAGLINEITAARDSCNGWADTNFEAPCKKCWKNINRDVLCADKFIEDVMAYAIARNDPLPSTTFQLNPVLDKRPLPSTLLDPRSGLLVTTSLMSGSDFVKKTSYFPIVLADTLSHVDSEGKTGHTPSWIHSIEGVRLYLETALNCRMRMLYATQKKQRRANKVQRQAVRRMMASYNDNPSIFGMDLVSAVHRQGKFVQKMQHLDWLHSPALSITTSRVIEKYRRFMVIINKCPSEMAVPTLDVDLAWHTNQLTPSLYYNYSLSKTGRFVDHDDKVSEHKLSNAFAITSKNYQRLFKEPYSECTCWYCEAMHATVSKYPGRFLLPNSAQGYRRPELSHDDQAAAHISTHNVVRLQNAPADYKANLQRHLAWLDKAYQRACERAKKDGRTPPVRRHIPAASANGHPAYYDGVGYGGGMSGKAAGAAVLIGGGLAVGMVAIAVTADGGLAFDDDTQHVDSRGGGGCAGGTCGGGVGWGGCADDSGGATGACGGGGGSCSGGGDGGGGGGSSCGGGCGGCGGCGGG